MASVHTLILYAMLALATMANAEMIVSNDIVVVEYFRDAACAQEAILEVHFDLCCCCFTWTFGQDSSAVEPAGYTLMDNNFSWTVQGHQDKCKDPVDFPDHTFHKFAATTCGQQTSGRTYYTKIKEVKHRSEACAAMSQSSLTCRQGAFPNEAFNDNWAWTNPNNSSESSGGNGNPVEHECMSNKSSGSKVHSSPSPLPSPLPSTSAAVGLRIVSPFLALAIVALTNYLI